MVECTETLWHSEEEAEEEATKTKRQREQIGALSLKWLIKFRLRVHAFSSDSAFQTTFKNRTKSLDYLDDKKLQQKH